MLFRSLHCDVAHRVRALSIDFRAPRSARTIRGDNDKTTTVSVHSRWPSVDTPKWTSRGIT